MAVNEHMAVTVAEMAVEAICISNSYDGYARGTRSNPAAVVPYTVSFWNVFDLGYFSFEGANWLDYLLHRGLGRDAVKPYAKTNHVELGLGEALYARRIEDMAENTGRGKVVAQSCTPFGETFYLSPCEGIHFGVVGTGKMRENGLDAKGTVGCVEATDKRRYIGIGESETVHPGIKFDMDGVLRAVGGHETDRFRETFKNAETVDVGFEIVTDYVVETFFFRVHHHDGERDAVATKVDAFIAVGDGKVVDMVVLKGVSNFDFAGTVAGSLDHGHETCARANKGAVVVEVVDEVVEIDFHDGLVGFATEDACYVFEVETAGSFEEDDFVIELVKVELVDEVACGGVEIGVEVGEELTVATECFANADEAGYTMGESKVVDMSIEVGFGKSGLEYITDD